MSELCRRWVVTCLHIKWVTSHMCDVLGHGTTETCKYSQESSVRGYMSPCSWLLSSVRGYKVTVTRDSCEWLHVSLFVVTVFSSWLLSSVRGYKETVTRDSCKWLHVSLWVVTVFSSWLLSSVRGYKETVTRDSCEWFLSSVTETDMYIYIYTHRREESRRDWLTGVWATRAYNLCNHSQQHVRGYMCACGWVTSHTSECRHGIELGECNHSQTSDHSQ